MARTRKIEMLRRDLANVALNPGELLAAQRDTPYGPLNWRITVRDDGRAGVLPTVPHCGFFEAAVIRATP